LKRNIDKQKFTFLCQLSLSRSHLKIKQIFIHRLFMYLTNPAKAKGFFPDIIQVFGKYDLQLYLMACAKHGTFPSKTEWKRIVKTSIHDQVETNWRTRVNNDCELRRYLVIHPQYKVCMFWLFMK